MGIRKAHIQQTGLYFITFTNYNWLPLIEQANAYDLVYSWFDYLKREGHAIVAYVIMPNHVHLMLAYRSGNKSINTLVGNGKRFMSYGIVERLNVAQQTNILTQLSDAVLFSERLKGKKHTVFRDSFHIQHCYSQQFILQKIKYIHDNPCVKKWMLASSPLAYPHSSARFYFEGIHATYPVLSWMDWDIEINPSM
jgi:REP element-mobilizing transposase RayT